MSPEQLHILQHSLGCDKYGNGTRYRNRFVTDAASPDGLECEALCALGFMVDHGAQEIAAGMHCFCVTQKGERAMAAESPKPDKLTWSQRGR